MMIRIDNDRPIIVIVIITIILVVIVIVSSNNSNDDVRCAVKFVGTAAKVK